MVPKTVLETVGGSMHGVWQNVKRELRRRREPQAGARGGRRRDGDAAAASTSGRAARVRLGRTQRHIRLAVQRLRPELTLIVIAASIGTLAPALRESEITRPLRTFVERGLAGRARGLAARLLERGARRLHGRPRPHARDLAAADAAVRPLAILDHVRRRAVLRNRGDLRLGRGVALDELLDRDHVVARGERSPHRQHAAGGHRRLDQLGEQAGAAEREHRRSGVVAERAERPDAGVEQEAAGAARDDGVGIACAA